MVDSDGGRGVELLKKVLGLGYWVQGFRCFPWLVVSFYLKDGLNVDPSTLQLLQNSANLPMVGKPLYGLVSDSIYINGQHRVPYIALGAKSVYDLQAMGAPKQKWTSEEEAALKAGVVKHGVGKWRTILKDPEFSSVLFLRSNVDLKDKWRNLSVMANGWSSREKSRLAGRRVHHALKQDENSVANTSVALSDEEIVDNKPLQISKDMLQIPGPRRSNLSLDKLIMEAITSLKENGGSNKTAITAFIEDQYWAQPGLKRMLSARLKFLTANGKLIKVNRKYRIAPMSAYSDRRRNSSMLFLDGRQKASLKIDRDETNILTKSQIDLELSKIRSMTPQEAAAYAARAVAEAEAAIAEAEEAAREADAAEADAEAAQAFADATTKSGKGRKSPRGSMLDGRLKN